MSFLNGGREGRTGELVAREALSRPENHETPRARRQEGFGEHRYVALAYMRRRRVDNRFFTDLTLMESAPKSTS
jgi:hypothetical protein